MDFTNVPIDVSQVAALNPLMDFFMIPFLDKVVYPSIEKKFNLTALKKISFGLVCSVIAFMLAGFIQLEIDKDGPVSILYQIPIFFFISLAEVTVYVPFLHYGYCEAPTRWKGFIQALCWFSIGVGNILITLATITSNNFLSGLPLFFFFAILMAIFTIIFIVIAIYYKPNQMGN